MSRSDQAAFASKCKTSLGYLRKAISTKQKLGVELVVRLHKNSSGRVPATSIRPDVDWSEFNTILHPISDDHSIATEEAVSVASETIKPIVSSEYTQISEGECSYSVADQERRRDERRSQERRDLERRNRERRNQERRDGERRHEG